MLFLLLTTTITIFGKFFQNFQIGKNIIYWPFHSFLQNYNLFLAPVAYSQEYEEIELYNNYDEYGPLIEGGGVAQAAAAATGKLGFSAGSGLRSIAEGSFNSANDAVNNQDAAGHQAAFVAKNTLAQSAAAVSITLNFCIFFLSLIFFLFTFLAQIDFLSSS